MEDNISPVSDEAAANYAEAITRFAVGYNKSVVLSSVTRHSMDILDESMAGIGRGLSSIVAAFEEIRATTGSTAANADRIDAMMRDIQANGANTTGVVEARMRDVEEGVGAARQIGAMFTGLKEKTKSVAGLTGSIQDVSDRTNILAINASIEAARAGAVGRGFRIIANEVRALAGQTGDFAKQIESSLGEFAEAVGAIAGRMDDFVAIFTRFRESFSEVTSAFRENAGSIESAGQVLTQIAGSLKEETKALGDGLDSLEGISVNAKDTHAVFTALKQSHDFLDRLLDREQ